VLLISVESIDVHAATVTHSGPSTTKRKRWYLLYFALAAFDLLAVSLGLVLNHRLVGLFKESVQVNQV